LIEHGVNAADIELIPDEQSAVEAALEKAEKDDLVLIFVDAISRTWRQIQEFKSEVEGAESETPVVAAANDVESFSVFDEGMFGSADFSSDVELIRDSRGVRVAVAEETD
jgi:cyanophycin synthetase